MPFSIASQTNRLMLRYDAKDLRGMPPADVRRMLARIETLRDEPRPPGSEKLSAQERYRLRQGNYRILYTVSDTEVVVEIVRIAQRREVYRDP
jgi:mRNA interferase RelE/StbE